MEEPKILSQETKYESDRIKIISSKVRLPNGNVAEWETPEPTHDSVAVVALDENNNVYLSKEWRIAWKKYVIIIPAGATEKTDDEEKLKIEARRELQEEIGFDCHKIEKLVTIFASARIRQKHHIYLATDLFELKKSLDENEIMEIIKMPIDKAIDLFRSGKEETTDYTFLGLILAKEKLSSL